MKAWQLFGFSLDKLVLVELKEQSLGDDEVRVKVKACSLNYRDLLVCKGLYNKAQSLPLIPLSDGAGEVIEVGSLVKNFKPGDKVCALFSQKWIEGRVFAEAQKYTLGSPLPGMLREEAIFHESGLIKFPDYLSYEEASCLPCAALTAFNALSAEALVKPKDIVLLEGTGGVSLWALQFAKALGCIVIISSSCDDKLAYCKKLGADHVINYKKTPAWHEEVLALTQKKGVDLVLDIGGAHTFNQAMLATKKGGMICVIGMVSGALGTVDFRPLLMKQIRVSGIFVGSKALFQSMNRVLEHTKIKPVISKTIDFYSAVDAFHFLESARHIGKVVISLSS
jgi:NADPH:quinone reductase-like Zn-dependent oxidoreductase